MSFLCRFSYKKTSISYFRVDTRIFARGSKTEKQNILFQSWEFLKSKKRHKLDDQSIGTR